MTAPDAGGSQSHDDGGEGSESRLFSQEKLNSLLAQQRREIEAKFEGFDEIRSKAAEFDKLEEQSKSEAQRANEALADYKSQLETVQSELEWRDTVMLRNRLAASKTLDPKLWDRVKGETEEEITADIEDLMSLSVPPKPKPSGFRSGATPPDQATAKERAASALRTIREAPR